VQITLDDLNVLVQQLTMFDVLVDLCRDYLPTQFQSKIIEKEAINKE
jgi:hypothetical protein